MKLSRRGRLAIVTMDVIAIALFATGWPVLERIAAASTDDNGGTVSYWAPDWPFQGAVHYYDFGLESGQSSLPATDAHYGIRFYSSIDGEVTDLRLGTSENLRMCGPGEMVVNRHGIVYDHLNSDFTGSTSMYIPWGDAAYPIYTQASLPGWPVDYLWHSTNSNRAAKMKIEESAIEVEYVDDAWVELAIGNLKRYYFVGDAGDLGDDEASLTYTPPDDPLPDQEIGHSVFVSGTDGIHYGISLTDESRCGTRQTYIFSVRSGALVACGRAYLGPILVGPDTSTEPLDDVAFPSEVYWNRPQNLCDGALTLDGVLNVAN